ncbi:MAG: hypothetical protein JW994_08120 [Candidatus Omnitrophica bacterium]|nr:hypothetical protein [Candidatus Omnitrophota bacterium]
MERFRKTENGISKSIGKAIAENSLIENNDKVLVGVSGGKDSLTLLKILSMRRKWVPIRYDITACHVLSNKACLRCGGIDKLKKFFEELGCDYIFEKSDIINETGDFSCFWCAWNRRKVLFNVASNMGISKVALGHNMDDLAETILMNLFFHGEISGLNPKQVLFDGKIVIIRPMIYLEEKLISRYAKEARFPVGICKCPNAEKSKRRYIKDLINDLSKKFKYVKKNIMNAPHRIKEEYLGVGYD